MRRLLPASRRGRIAAGAGLAVLFVLLVLLSLGARRLLHGPSVVTEEVVVGPFRREVSATGVLKSVKATPIVVPTDSDGPQKIAWMAVDGSRVKAGDPVVLFDPTEAKKNLEDGKSDRATADNKIEKTAAENKKTQAGLALDLDLAKSESERAETFASKDTDIFSRNEIITSQIDRDLLSKRADSAKYKSEKTSKLGAADIALGEIERNKADIRIRQAEKGLGSLRVLAPHDGIIVFERNWRGETLSVGETCWPGQKIAEIPDLGELEAKVFVLEADAGGLKPGQSARVTIEAHPGKEYLAKVSRVDAMAKTRNWRSPIKYFETILSLPKTESGTMKPGQAVRAVLALEEVANAVSVPRGAVFEKDGKRVVYKLDGGRFEPVEVTLGHASLARVVIEKGIEAGDRIALRDPTRETDEILGTGGKERERKGTGVAGAADADD